MSFVGLFTRSAGFGLIVATLLCSCSKTSTETSYSTDENGNVIKTTTIKEVQAKADGTPPKVEEVKVRVAERDHDYINDPEVMEPESEKIEVDVDEEPVLPERTRVRAPFVRIDADDRDGSVHVNAPFVRVNKNGHGSPTTVRIPGITIRGD